MRNKQLELDFGILIKTTEYSKKQRKGFFHHCIEPFPSVGKRRYIGEGLDKINLHDAIFCFFLANHLIIGCLHEKLGVSASGFF